jgi:hypothetical protein
MTDLIGKTALLTGASGGIVTFPAGSAAAQAVAPGTGHT